MMAVRHFSSNSEPSSINKILQPMGMISNQGSVFEQLQMPIPESTSEYEGNCHDYTKN